MRSPNTRTFQSETSSSEKDRESQTPPAAPRGDRANGPSPGRIVVRANGWISGCVCSQGMAPARVSSWDHEPVPGTLSTKPGGTCGLPRASLFHEPNGSNSPSVSKGPVVIAVLCCPVLACLVRGNRIIASPRRAGIDGGGGGGAGGYSVNPENELIRGRRGRRLVLGTGLRCSRDGAQAQSSCWSSGGSDRTTQQG